VDEVTVFGGGSVTNTNIICYRCKAEGHKRNECPELTKTSEAEHQPKSNPTQRRTLTAMSLADEGIKRDSSISVRQQIVNASEKCPTSLIKLNGYDFICLLDTESEVFTISVSFYSKNLSNLELSDTRTFLKLVAANNIPIPYLGYIEVDVKIFGCVFSNVGFLVSKGSSSAETTDGILGCNILKYI